MIQLTRLQECRACLRRTDARCGETGELLELMAARDPWPCPHGAAVRPPHLGQLAVVASLFNPANVAALSDNWRHWRAGMQPWLDAGRISHCLTAEAIYPGQRPTVDPAAGDIVLDATPDQVLWQKERLLNLAIDALPNSVTAVAWIDPDFHFLSPTWPEDTLAELQHHAVAQMFTQLVMEKTLHGELQVWPATMAISPRSDCWAAKAKPGGAWALRRDVLAASGGLYDAAVWGSGDACMLFAWVDQAACRRHPQLKDPGPVRDHWQRWARRSAAAVQGRVGCVRGTIVHRFHGTRKDRQYLRRHEIATRHGFDPSMDIEIAPNGLWRWTDPESPLARETAEYFIARNDDAGRDVARRAAA